MYGVELVVFKDCFMKIIVVVRFKHKIRKNNYAAVSEARFA